MAFPHTAWASEVGGTGLVSYYRYRSGVKQTAPIDRSLQLGYVSRIATAVNRGVGFVAAGDNYPAQTVSANGVPAGLCQQAQIEAAFPRYVTATKNKCYDKFLSEMSDRASMGETLAELGSSAKMISERVLQITRFARRLKKGDLPGAWVELTSKDSPRRMPKKYATSKSYSGAFLEAHLGWSPLIKDIYSAVDVLQSPLKAQRVRARTSSPFEGYLVVPSHTWRPTATYPSPYMAKSYSRVKGKISVQMGANIGVSNPNLWLANQLGLINPAQVAWALVPFSFVADWFVNVSQVLNSATDFVGLSVSGGYTSVRIEGSGRDYSERYFRWYNQGYFSGGGIQKDSEFTFKGLERTAGLATPSLIFQPYKVPSLWRAATAVSLLVQFLPRK